MALAITSLRRCVSFRNGAPGFASSCRMLGACIPNLRDCTVEVRAPSLDAPVWEELRQADLIFAVYAQYHDLMQYLPLLAGTGPRIVFDYLGVTPPELWPDQQREGLEISIRQRGYAWCADHVLATSATTRRELLEATGFPRQHVTRLPPAIDTARFLPEPDERPLRTKLDITGPILLFVGRLAGNKRVPLLIEALAHRQDAHAVLVGDCGDVYEAEAARCRRLRNNLAWRSASIGSGRSMTTNWPGPTAARTCW